MLRANHTAVETLLHRHSVVSLRLRAESIDAETRMNARLQYMQAWAALHGNPKAKIDDAGDKLKIVYYDALNELPYLTAGKSGMDVQNDERMQAVEEYRKFKNNVLRPGTEAKKKPWKPGAASKHRRVPA